MRPVGVFLAAAALLAFSTALSQTVPPDDSQPRIGRKPTIELDIPAGNQIHDMYDTSRLDAIGRIRLEIKVSVAARKLVSFVPSLSLLFVSTWEISRNTRRRKVVIMKDVNDR